MSGTVRVGIGGWSFAPWRGTFYPPKLPAARELGFASRQVTAIEISGTFYRTQSPASFARWAAEAPPDFVFAVKAARVATYRREPEDSVAHFLNSGVDQLGPKLGPILWQFPATRRYEPAAMEAFLDLLPERLGERKLRHVVEARHPSFADPGWIAQVRARGVAVAMIERDDEPYGDLTADFVYARLERNEASAPEGYASSALDAWKARLQNWAGGQPVDDLPNIVPGPSPVPRDCFVFFIGGAKVRAPDAARSMLTRLAD